MAKVTVSGQDYEVDENSEESLMNQLKDKGVEIVAACNGAGICQTCAIEVDEDEQDKLTPKTDTEEMMDLPDGQRLSCQCMAKGDLKSVKLVY